MIQRGDSRQYIENAITQVSDANNFAMANQALSAGTQITQQAMSAKLADYQVDFGNRLQIENDRINTKYQADPTNPERIKEFNESIDNIASSYEISPFMNKQWNDSVRKYKNDYSRYNNDWMINQQKNNAKIDIQNAVKKSLDSVGLENGDFNPERLKLNFANNYNAIANAAIPILGSKEVENFLQDYQHDYIAMRISKQIDDNPALAVNLLKNPDVRNDIGRLSTIESLEKAAQVKLQQFNKEVALDKTANLIIQKGAIGQKIMEGTLSTAQLQQVTKGLTPNERDIIWGMAGYSTSQKFSVDRTTGAIKYNNDGGSSSDGFDLSKINNAYKQNYIAGLEIKGANLLNFTPENITDMKGIKGNQAKHEVVSNLLGMVKDYQDEVNAAYNSGLIGKDDVNRLQRGYVDRVAGYVQGNVKNLSENSGFLWRNKTGYDGLKEQFAPPSGATKSDKEAIERDLGKATIAYFSSLEKLAKQNKLDNVYDIEKLGKEKQQEIYRQAQQEAIVRTKAYTNNPSYWIQKDHPSQYSAINNALTKKDAKKASAMFLQEIVKTPEMKYEEQNAITNHIIKSTIDKNREASKVAVQKALTAQPSSVEKRASALNVTMADVQATAKKYNMTPQQVLTKLEMNKK